MQSNARNRAYTFFFRRIALVAAKAAAIALLLYGALGAPGSSQAKLDPYYILRGQSFGQFKPRVLFALDTSGSMTWRPTAPDQYAVRPAVEGENPATASRIHGARRAIHKVIEETQDQASFSLMTFGHVRPPQNSGQVPTPCYYGGNTYRFWWVTYTQMGGGWQPLWNDFGTQGYWELCGDNRGFAYLRHDDLGGFNMPDDQGGDPPPAPLVKSVANLSAFTSGANWSRKVQFFPQFLGVRRNLDCNDPSDKSILDRSFGDYGNSSPTRDNNICGRDFYYWPYVDGFPGYSHYRHYSPWSSNKVECNVNEYCYWYNSQYHWAGTNRRTYQYHATLFAPFYSKAVLDSMAIPQSAKGPKNKADAVDLALGMTSDTDEGGIDAHYGTPWASAVGDSDWYVTVNGQDIDAKPGAIPQTNAPFGHTTISSYLSFMTTVSDEDLCVPSAAVLISDGQPSPGEGGSTLHNRLSKIRKRLGIKAYVVGFSDGFLNDPWQFAQLQNMACAAAGSNDIWNPCNGTNDFDWDTCADPNDPAGGCAWEASDPDQLAEALIEIVNGVIETPVPAGPTATANEFVPDQNDPNLQDAVQTTISGYTETPAWKGHVTREACDTVDENNDLEEFCALANDPLPADPDDEENFSDGGQTGCGFSRVWDAGECLQNKIWNDRRIYASDASDGVYRISEDDGSASAKFVAELDAMNLLTPGKEQQEADEIAAFLLGQNAPDGWKLSGLATSTPIVVRRIPERTEFAPSVGIRDPHCAGRLLGANQEVPVELQSFADEAWESVPASGKFSKHREYAEAVLVGTDMGLLHAFHFDSGNELFAFLPQNLLPHVAELAANGPAAYGQPPELENHRFGISSTINQGWVYDEDGGTWRHLAVIGFGKGGTEYVAVDLAHMARLENGDPIEVLWSTWTVDDAGWKKAYEEGLGQTWSRPALSYAVPDGPTPSISQNPRAYLVFASGYPENAAKSYQGHTLFMVDAVTGETFGELAYFPGPNDPNKIYDTVDDYALVPDPAVATYCESGYWGEMQETYLADPYGQLFRWDLGFDAPGDFPPHHEADSVSPWSGNGNVAQALFQFRACQGTGKTCSVLAGNRGDVFTYSPAVVSKDRIDELNEAGTPVLDDRKDELLVALVSGSANDDAIDGGDDKNDFHSSLYLMVDDHQNPTPLGEGLTVPGIGGITPAGSHAKFMRLPLSEIERTREWQYPDGTWDKETRTFSKLARPISAPRIDVTGAVDKNDPTKFLAEVYYVTYVVYEPGVQTCDPRWYDEDAEEWGFDYGSTYEIKFRIDTAPGEDFDFINGSGVFNGQDAGDGFGTTGSGLNGVPLVEQNRDGECADGNCGPQSPDPKNRPCDPNEYNGSTVPSQTITMGWSELDGFSPLEIPVP
jgi:hypothetical protein